MGIINTFDQFQAELLPRAMDTGAVARLRSHARALRVAANASARLNGGSGNYVYLARGTAKLVAHGSGGWQQVVAFHFAGDLLLVPEPLQHAYSLDAITPCDMLAIKAADVLEVARNDARFAVLLLDRMTAALADAREVSLTLGRKRAYERVAGFLLSMRTRVLGTKAGDAPVSLPMSRRDIGDNLAITVESISREVARLRADRLIDTPSRGKVRVLDAEGLAARAGFFANAT